MENKAPVIRLRVSTHTIQLLHHGDVAICDNLDGPGGYFAK